MAADDLAKHKARASAVIVLNMCSCNILVFYNLCMCRIVLTKLHWNGNVFILMKFSSLAALEVVKMTTSSAASD